MSEAKPGESAFYIVTNAQIYAKVIEMEKQVSKITTIFSLVALVVAPVVSVTISVVVGRMVS